jgi:hypothetical protein
MSKLLQSCVMQHLARDLFADFLSLPQGSPLVHSFFTRAKYFSLATRNILLESGFSEYVAILKACQRMIAVTRRQTGNSRG